MKGLTYNDLSQLAYLFVFVGIVLAVGVWTTGETGKTFDTTSTTNESFTMASNTTYVTLGYQYIKSISAIYNMTNATGLDSGKRNASSLIAVANYSLSGDSNAVRCCGATDAGWYPAGTFLVDYVAYGDSYVVMRNSTMGILKMSSWLPIVAIVLSAAIIVGILSLYLGRREGL